VWEWDKLKRIFLETLEDESIFLLDGCVLGSVDELGNIYPGAGKKKCGPQNSMCYTCPASFGHCVCVRGRASLHFESHCQRNDEDDIS